jgi:hypothetical protein
VAFRRGTIGGAVGGIPGGVSGGFVSGFSVTLQNNRLGWIDIAPDWSRNGTSGCESFPLIFQTGELAASAEIHAGRRILLSNSA